MEWLSDIIGKVLSVIPRLVFVFPDEAGVRITLGSRVKLLSPGWYIHWPLIQEFSKINVTPQVVDLRAQSVYPPNHKDMCVSGAVQYRIRDDKNGILKKRYGKQ